MGLRMQPRNEGFFTLFTLFSRFSKAGSNVVESAAIRHPPDSSRPSRLR
jgi:hypothetical protein